MAITLSETTWRMYVGPYHLHYDWSALDLGDSFAPSGTTTTGQISGATSLVIASSSGIGAATGLWVGPNGSGQGWEYQQVTAGASTTKTVVRESTTDREHNGVHSSSALVYQWYPVTTNDGSLNISDECDDTVATITWRGGVSGVRAPQHVLRNGHVVVITTSTNGGTYTIAQVGFVDSPTLTDDMYNNAEWTMNIISSAQLVAEVDARGVRVGDVDLADAGSATSSQELVLAFDERASGDYTAAAPDLSAASAIDNELSTLWIAEHYTGTDIWSETENDDPENGYPLRFSQIYINPPASAPPGSKWIELAVVEALEVVGYNIYSANGGLDLAAWLFKGPGDLEPRARIILAEDAAVFSQMNPLAETAAIYENKTFFAGIQADGGEFWLRFGPTNSWQARVRWGDGNGTVDHEDSPSRSWDGDTLTPPAIGETMRYLFNHTTGDAVDYWETGMVRHAGYDVDDDDPIWILVSLPGLELTLAQTISSTLAGSDKIYINGPDEKYSTDGLPSTGNIMIGDEIIFYGSKTGEYLSTITRANAGTTAAIHNEKDAVYVLDDSTPTDAYLIKELGWQRSGGTIYPKDFVLRASNLINAPRTPDQDNYTDDYHLGYSETGNTDSSWSVPLYGERVKHVLIEIMNMTTNPSRPRINEINAIVDPALHNPDLWLSGGTSAGALIQQILETAGIPSGAISHSSTPVIANTVTADENAWSVVADLAEYSGCRVTVTRDSKFIIAADTFWTGTPTVATTWNRDSAVSIQQSFSKGTPVSQVILPWKAPSGEADGKIYYPETPGRGTKLEQPETLYASESAATNAARRLYFMRLYPFESMVTAADTVSDKRAGEAHQIVWKFTDDMQSLDRLCVCMGADHRLEKGTWSSTFRLRQYGHESNL